MSTSTSTTTVPEEPEREPKKGEEEDKGTNEEQHAPPQVVEPGIVLPLDEAGPPVLFVSHFPKSLSEDDCKTMFERYGTVTLFVLCKDRATGESKGSGFLRFERQDSTDRCAAILHEKYTIPGMGAPMIVRPASRPYPGDVAAALLAQGGGAAGPAKLFVGHLPSATTEADLRPVFEPFGRVLEVVVLRTGTVSRCCGFVNMESYAAALSAARALNDKLQLDPNNGTVVVRLADGRGHCTRLCLLHPILPSPPSAQVIHIHGQTETTGGGGAPQYGRSYAPARSSTRPRQRQGPPGANLYVRGLPHSFADHDLAGVFAPFGTVVSAKVFVDPASGESRGFGFVSFDSVAAAQHAIAQMNGAVLAPGMPLCVQPKSEPAPYAPYPPLQFQDVQMRPPASRPY